MHHDCPKYHTDTEVNDLITFLEEFTEAGLDAPLHLDLLFVLITTSNTRDISLLLFSDILRKVNLFQVGLRVKLELHG